MEEGTVTVRFRGWGGTRVTAVNRTCSSGTPCEGRAGCRHLHRRSVRCSGLGLKERTGRFAYRILVDKPPRKYHLENHENVTTSVSGIFVWEVHSKVQLARDVFSNRPLCIKMKRLYTNGFFTSKYRSDWCSGNAVDLHSGTRRPSGRDTLTWLSISVGFLSPFSQVPGIVPRLGHVSFPPNYFQLIIHQLP
jgi:hypothetical protein